MSPLEPVLLRRLGLGSPLPKARPVYRHLVHAIERAIAAGSLEPSHRLPAERQLASALGVSRTTVVSAYRELESLGLVRGYVGRGTFVSAAPDASGAPFAWRGKLSAAAMRSTDSMIRDLCRDSIKPGLISLAAGIPALERFPAKAFRESLDKVLVRDPRLCGDTVRRKDSRRCVKRLRADSAARPKTSWCWPARSRGSICSSAA